MGEPVESRLGTETTPWRGFVRIEVDWSRCEGHGMCADVEPQLFQLDDEGQLQVHPDAAEVPEPLQRRAEAAVRRCPVAALRIEP